jgi:hypothetical protein
MEAHGTGSMTSDPLGRDDSESVTQSCANAHNSGRVARTACALAISGAVIEALMIYMVNATQDPIPEFLGVWLGFILMAAAFPLSLVGLVPALKRRVASETVASLAGLLISTAGILVHWWLFESLFPLPTV